MALRINEEKEKELQQIAKKKGGLCEALWDLASDRWYSSQKFDTAWKLLERTIGKPLTEVHTVEEFWKPKVKRAVCALVGEKQQRDFVSMMQLQLDCQFSWHSYRRSYRTKDFGWHASKLVGMLRDWINVTTYGIPIEEMLKDNYESVRGYEMYMALELVRRNETFDSAVREAILGENQTVLLSRMMIRAVIISGREDLLELLLALLSAARLQEGLRQQILENADAGSARVMKRILKFCIDEDMFRYSSTIRAFDTWTGLGYGDEKAATVQKYALLAYECLENKAVRERYIESPNNLEAYLALWATGTEELEKTERLAVKFLDDKEKYRRILGWYFITHSGSTRYRMQMASRYLAEREPEILVWIVGNLAQTSQLIYSYGVTAKTRKHEPVIGPDLPADRKERRRIFYQLKELVRVVGTKETMFTGNPFPFSWIKLESDRVVGCMLSLAGYDMDGELIEELHSVVPDMTPDQRRAYYLRFLTPETNGQHKEYLREALHDKSVQVKGLAVEILAECRLTDKDLDAIAECLRSKSSSLRKSVLTALQQQEPGVQAQILGKLLASEEQFQIQAGIELLLEKKDGAPEFVAAQRDAIAALRQQKLSTQTEILLRQLEGGDESEPAYSEENGYGLYDKAVLAEILESAGEALKGRAFSKKELTEVLSVSGSDYFALLERMNEVFVRHANYEYETLGFDGSVQKILFGDVSSSILRASLRPGEDRRYVRRVTPETIPFFDEFLEALGEYATDVTRMLALCFVASRWRASYFGPRDVKPEPWYVKLMEQPLFATYHDAGKEKYKNRYFYFLDIIDVLPGLFSDHEIFEKAFEIFLSVLQLVGMENLGKKFAQMKENDGPRYMSYSFTHMYAINQRIIGYWRTMLSSHAVSDDDFKRWFFAEYALEQSIPEGTSIAMRLTDKEYFRAQAAGLIPADAVYAHFLVKRFDDQVPASQLRLLTNPTRYKSARDVYEQYPGAKEMVQTLVQRIVEVEEKRGELATPLTKLAASIDRFEGGAEHFVKLLAALGNETFFRGYLYGARETKQAILSLLLKRCYPAKGDSPERLREYLEQTDITEKRLAEAVMYAPQWAGFAEQITGWKGLKSGVWFFHAHVNETFSAEKETEVALYSPITPQQFNDGAFDKDWFTQAHQMLGEKRFQTLYKCAKYITSGGNQHRRSQLYADAVLGKLDADSLKAEITEKRNQDKLRCYPLIPIPENNVKIMLERYEFIQKFLKESRQFGAQRRENERKACNAAMENLAITTGFYDVNRLTWYLESEKIKEIRDLMEPKELEGVRIWVEINDEGIAELAVEKGGKRQKSVPTTLKKDPLILERKETIKELKEQRSRARESLERAMTECTAFRVEELRKIAENPVLFPLVGKLVWVLESGEEKAENIGFVQKDGELVFTEVNGISRPLGDDFTLRVAHPHDMMQAGVWSELMQLLYREKIVQPFKQVFREYYPVTEDELRERTVSRRYAGHQVQPQKTVALLRGRGWTVDYEEGLQKVFYKENLIVRMFAMADWFSPADIEAPTLETIRFFDRNSEKGVEFAEVPPVVFSEVMRDIDLVVSVAHVGGVDPEASHSTVEMRTAIAAELVKLLALSNVTFIGSHAKITGSLANYSVHMGSGVVHAEAVGMVNILPVHSQSRGRIFLPFADDDPKTAEIMSKILLLAEDKKIKDPSILQQLR